MKAGYLLVHRCHLIAFTATVLLLSSGCGVVGEVGDGAQGAALVTDMVDVPDEVLRASSSGYQTFANGAPTVLYLNFDGATITKSNKSDASTNTSFIGGGTVPSFPGTQADRQQVISFVKQLYARYNIQIVTSRPAAGDYDMALFGGTPADLNLNVPSNVAGVAPMDCDNKMKRDIAFIFAGSIKAILGSSSKFAQRVAETGAHEAGHTYGLPHSGVGCDLMSYSQCATLKTFLDQTMPMQSDSYGKCGMTQMNSHSILIGALGAVTSAPPTDTTAPKVTITSPQGGATVSAALTVKASISDDTGVAKGQLLVDGKVVASRNGAPFDFAVNLAAGSHTLKVLGHDAAGNKGEASVNVTVQGTTPTPGDKTPPAVTITSPAAGAVVGQQVTVKATVTDASGVSKVELRADGKLVKSLTAGPWSFDINLAAGAHLLQVGAQDAAGNTGSASVSVTVDASKPSTPPTPPTPPSPGTFGASCSSANDCQSGLCAEDPDLGGRYCTQTCAENSACPDDAGCFPTNSANVSVCGPPQLNRNALDGDEILLGSCSVGAGGSARVGVTPALLLLLLALHLRLRRRS